jgi:hypothetical protein
MLKILGVVFLVLIGLVVAFFTVLFFKVKGGMQKHARVAAIEEGMNTPNVVLEQVEQPSYAQPEVVAELVEQIVALDATTCGNYDVPAADIRLCAYRLESPPVYVVVYDHDQVEPWIDVVLRFRQDRSFTASTAPELSRGAPRHPDDEILYFAPGTAIAVLIQAAAERASGEDTLPAMPEAFKTCFEEAAEKSTKYIQTQAVSQEWLSAIAEDTGVELSGDEAEQINLGRESEQVMRIENDCLKSLAESGEFTAAQWNDMRDCLVVVWDDMPGEYVSNGFFSHADVPEDMESAVDALEDGRGLARERIAQLNAQLPEERRLILVGTVSSPVQADVYRGRNLVV